MEKQSITALMSCFGRTYHAENERHPVFRDTLAKQLLTEEDKKRRIERAGWPAAENLTFVPADLAADDLAAAGHGWLCARRAGVFLVARRNLLPHGGGHRAGARCARGALRAREPAGV